LISANGVYLLARRLGIPVAHIMWTEQSTKAGEVVARSVVAENGKRQQASQDPGSRIIFETHRRDSNMGHPG
jgi:hypothetical protein